MEWTLSILILFEPSDINPQAHRKMLSFASGLLSFVLLATVGAQDISVATVQNSLKQAGIIPEVFPANFQPQIPLEVSYSLWLGEVN